MRRSFRSFRSFRSLRTLGAVLIGGVVGALSMGCGGDGDDASSGDQKLEDQDQVVTQSWTSGGQIYVDGIYGDVVVVEGSADSVRVTFTPFIYASSADATEARARLAQYIDLVVEARADGGVQISTNNTAGSADDDIGADIQVELPTNFDSVLTVDNRSGGAVDPGDIDVQFVANATTVVVSTSALGDCRVRGNATVTQTTAFCDGAVDISGVSDNVTVEATGNETGSAVSISLTSISALATGGSIDAEQGDVSLTLPAAASFGVQAETQQGTVDPGVLPTNCGVQVADARSQTVSCNGGGALYVVSACLNGAGACDISLSYQ